jgi:hypothetical protein
MWRGNLSSRATKLPKELKFFSPHVAETATLRLRFRHRFTSCIVFTPGVNTILEVNPRQDRAADAAQTRSVWRHKCRRAAPAATFLAGRRDATNNTQLTPGVN